MSVDSWSQDLEYHNDRKISDNTLNIFSGLYFPLSILFYLNELFPLCQQTAIDIVAFITVNIFTKTIQMFTHASYFRLRRQYLQL